MKSQLFEKWFEKDLLKELPYGSVLIMNSASFYRKDVLYEILKKYQYTLIFLPPYSPEYNPIELNWSALKRKVASGVHLYGSVSQALDEVLKGI